MARISGVDLPNDKRVEIGLTYIFGIGLSSSRKILQKTGINPDTRVKDLNNDEISKLREIIDREYKVEGDLRRNVALTLKDCRRLLLPRNQAQKRPSRQGTRTKQTPERVKVQSVQWLTRRNNKGVILWLRQMQKEQQEGVSVKI